MGDRVLIVAHAGADNIAPAVYGHWFGHEAPELLVAAGEAGIIRQGDPSYSAARICGFFHEQDNRSTTGLGLMAAPADLELRTLENYSQGDAGVITVDVRDGSLAYFASYHGRDPDDEDYEAPPTGVKLSG